MNPLKEKKKEASKSFIRHIDFLKESKGIAYKVIAEKIGISENKIKAIRRGGSSADTFVLGKLVEVYPELAKNKESQEQKTTLDWREDRRLDHVTDEEYKEIKSIEKMYFDTLRHYKELIERQAEELKRKDQQLAEKDSQLYNLINKILKAG